MPLRCPKCSSRRGNEVVDSGREPNDVIYIKRRRECVGCGHRFNTREYCDTVSQWQLNDIAKMRRKLQKMKVDIDEALLVMSKKRISKTR